MITRQEFEEQYAARSGISIEWLKREGQISLPCHCDEDGCQGWQMVSWRLLLPVDLEFIPEPYKTEVTLKQGMGSRELLKRMVERELA